MARFEENGIRSHFESAGVKILQRLDDRGHEVGTTADRFRENQVGPFALFEVAHFLHEFIEFTTETSSGNFLNGEALGAQAGGIDEILSLVVGDQSDPLPIPNVLPCETGQSGGFACPEKAANHDKTNRLHIEILQWCTPRCA